MQQGICEACHSRAKLVRHHWYQHNAPGMICTKDICYYCNSRLKTKSDSKSNHFLPSWEEQKDWLVKDLFLWYKNNDIETLRLGLACVDAGAFYWDSLGNESLDATLVLDYVG